MDFLTNPPAEQSPDERWLQPTSSVQIAIRPARRDRVQRLRAGLVLHKHARAQPHRLENGLRECLPRLIQTFFAQGPPPTRRPAALARLTRSRSVTGIRG